MWFSFTRPVCSKLSGAFLHFAEDYFHDLRGVTTSRCLKSAYGSNTLAATLVCYTYINPLTKDRIKTCAYIYEDDFLRQMAFRSAYFSRPSIQETTLGYYSDYAPFSKETVSSCQDARDRIEEMTGNVAGRTTIAYFHEGFGCLTPHEAEELVEAILTKLGKLNEPLCSAYKQHGPKSKEYKQIKTLYATVAAGVCITPYALSLAAQTTSRYPKSLALFNVLGIYTTQETCKSLIEDNLDEVAMNICN